MLLTALLLRAALADATPCDPSSIDGYISEVTTGSPEAYQCLADLDAAGPALLAAVEGAEDPAAQLTRALTVHWMQRLDQLLPHEVARALPAGDRRLLSDAVRARLGRTSPAPEHARVFEQFDWYEPDPRYTDRRLTEQDRANLAALAAPPPPPPPPEEPSAADVIADAAATPATERGCQSGCAAAHPASLAPMLLALLFVRHRQD
jgi:hypothetical protein